MKKLIIHLVFIPALIMSQIVWAQDTLNEKLQKALDLVQKGQKEEASALLTEIMKSHPDNKQAVQYWLMINMKRSPTGEPETIRQLDSLYKFYPDNAGLLFYKSFILQEYGKNEEALLVFDQLILQQPDSAVNWIGKGQILRELKKFEEAVVAFDRATLLDPGRIDVWNLKAVTLSDLKKYEEALTAINKAVVLDPGDAGTIYNRACIYSLKGDKIKALADLKTAIEKWPQFKQHAREDEDLKSLREDEEFRKLTE